MVLYGKQTPYPGNYREAPALSGLYARVVRLVKPRSSGTNDPGYGRIRSPTDLAGIIEQAVAIQNTFGCCPYHMPWGPDEASRVGWDRPPRVYRPFHDS